MIRALSMNDDLYRHAIERPVMLEGENMHWNWTGKKTDVKFDRYAKGADANSHDEAIGALLTI